MHTILEVTCSAMAIIIIVIATIAEIAIKILASILLMLVLFVAILLVPFVRIKHNLNFLLDWYNFCCEKKIRSKKYLKNLYFNN